MARVILELFSDHVAEGWMAVLKLSIVPFTCTLGSCRERWPYIEIGQISNLQRASFCNSQILLIYWFAPETILTFLLKLNFNIARLG